MASKSDSKAAEVIYGPTADAQLTPRRLQNKDGVWVGVGGKIAMPAKPPHKEAYEMREATQEEYAYFYNDCRLVSLVEIVEAK